MAFEVGENSGHGGKGKNSSIAVINDEMITQAVLHGVKDSRNAQAIQETGATHSTNDSLNAPSKSNSFHAVDFSAIQVLSLSFKNIFKIDNLFTLRDLVSLKLDNNIIHEIEGIDHLVSLKWLDLSFNKITCIQGLNTLVHLTDLTLYNNQITKLENLDNLKKLQVLSIGNNRIPTMENLLYLRCLNALKVLNFEGNPVCSDPEYRLYVLAHLDQLKYLDYAMVEASEIQQAREQYQDDLEEWKEIKTIEDAVSKKDQEKEEEANRWREANILILVTLFEDMFKDDVEISKVQALPGMQTLIEDYSDKFKALTEEVKPRLLGFSDQMAEECRAFQNALHELQVISQGKSIELCDQYQKTSKAFFRKAVTMSAAQLESDLTSVTLASEKLINRLMELETDAVEQTQELMETLEVNLSELLNEGKSVSTEHFRAVEELENSYFDSVAQLASHLLERLSSEDIDEDESFNEEIRAILNDRDTLSNAINGSHDIHIGKLLSQEDLLNEQGAAKIAKIVKDYRDELWKKSRARTTEILNLKDKNKNEVMELKKSRNSVEEDED